MKNKLLRSIFKKQLIHNLFLKINLSIQNNLLYDLFFKTVYLMKNKLLRSPFKKTTYSKQLIYIKKKRITISF